MKSTLECVSLTFRPGTCSAAACLPWRRKRFALQMRDLNPETEKSRGKASCRRRSTPQDGSMYFEPGDVVFCQKVAHATTRSAQGSRTVGVCSQYFFLAHQITDASPEFLAWQINRAPAQRYLASNAEGSDQLSIVVGRCSKRYPSLFRPFPNSG